jgi:hypothetical protein
VLGLSIPARTVAAPVSPVANITTHVKVEAKEAVDIFFMK